MLRSLAMTDLCVGIIALLSVLDEGRTKEAKDEVYYFEWSVFVYTDCSKCGQTSRLVVRTQVQTICNFEANISYCNYF